MWIFTRYGFFSIACANKPGSGSIDADVVMVRSRLKEHLLNLQERFKDASLAKLSIESSSHTDYRYRLVMPKAEWAAVLSEMATEQTWRNFKNEASLFERAHNLSRRYVDVLHDIWGVMHRLQIHESDDTSNKIGKSHA
jgi:predicted small integral membrane protein